MDEALRADTRRAAAWADVAAQRAQRVKDRRGGVPRSVDWDAPHRYDIVGGMQTQNYGRALANLRSLCVADELEGRIEAPLHSFHDGLYRPLTFLETWQTRIREYHAESFQGLPLWSWSDTCTGIYYQKETQKFKLAAIAEELLDVAPDFNKPFIEVDYDSVPGREFDPKNAIYNQPLTREQVLDHEAWNAAFEGNYRALEEASELVFEVIGRINRDTAMAFFLAKKLDQDGLFVLNLDSPMNYYSIFGAGCLNVGARLIRVRPR